MTHFLGLDIGTSAVKGVLVDEGQHIVAAATRPIATAQPRPGWSEQAPEDWWRAVQATAAEIAGAAPAAWRSIKSIGLSGQMHGLVPIDAAGVPIRPAILWNDSRAAAEAAELAATVPDMTRLAGVLPMAGLTAPKALWLKRHEPESFARLSCLLLPKDYVRLQMTGQRLTDVSDAAGTLWLDQTARAWSPAFIAASGLRPEHLPPMVEGPTPAGHLLPAIACAWNLPVETLVVGGGGDATLGAIGIGAVHDGDAFISIGTSAQYYVTRDCYAPSAGDGMIHNFAQALPQTWSQMAALLNGASCLTWAAGIFGDGDIARALAEVEADYKGPGAVTFLPYLAGERTPHNDPLARGMFSYLSHATTRADLFQAVLEGVGHALVDAQDALRAVGARVGQGGADHLAIVGGGARSRLWVRIIAGMLGKDLTLYDGADRGPAFGAARLARLGFTGESIAEVCTRPPVLAVIEPEAELTEAYAARQAHFRGLYQATKTLASQR